MTELLSKINAGELIGLVAVGGGLLTGMIAIVGGLWSDVRKAEMAAFLKQDMLNRGMSAWEIQTVLDAGTERSGKTAEERRANCA